LQLESALAAHTVHIIANGGSAGLNRHFEYLPHASIQAAGLWSGQCSGDLTGLDPAVKERFIRVDIAHAGNTMLVEQQGFDRPLVPEQRLAELLGCHFRGFRSKGTKGRIPVRFIGCQKKNASESARIFETDFQWISFHGQNQVGMFCCGFFGPLQEQPSGHTQMEDKTIAGGEPAQYIFTAPEDLTHPRPF
jgi:hypothetical protein